MTSSALLSLRRELGLTQGELAARLGVTLRTVQRWEAGDVPISEPAARLLERIVDDVRSAPARRRRDG